MQTANVHPAVKVTGRHLVITDAINEYATRKIEGLHLDYPKIIEAHVILGVEKYRHWAEVDPHLLESHHDRSLRRNRRSLRRDRRGHGQNRASDAEV